MQIIPVIDLKQGLVVRGVGGRRDEYRPIESRLVEEPTAAAVASAFARLGFTTTYVADLDAIAGAEPAFDLYAQMLDCGLQLWVDAGLNDLRAAEHLSAFQHHGRKLAALVAGLESMPSLDWLKDLLARVGPERTVVSLDLKAGQPLTRCAALAEQTPLEIATQMLALGVQKLIVLDLAQVGEGQGTGTEKLCRQIRHQSANVTLIAGGGIRHQQDLHALTNAGCNAALVASALHDGTLLER